MRKRRKEDLSQEKEINKRLYIDLHVHSNASDGTYTPNELVKYADEKGLYAFALTDHDTVNGIEEALETAKDYDVKVIPGIELSADFKGSDLHILGLNVDHKSEGFLEMVEHCKRMRDERNLKMIAKMNEQGFPITKQILDERYGVDAVITRAHFARYLLEEGFVNEKNKAFSKYLGKGRPCYVSRQLITPKMAIELILKSGGHPILAHPLLYGFNANRLKGIISYLKELGLEGIEALYSLNRVDDDQRLLKYAKNFGLYVTGGSDFHGSNKPDIDLGVGKGNLRVTKDLLGNIGGVL